MERNIKLNRKVFILMLAALAQSELQAESLIENIQPKSLLLQKQPGFFRFSYDTLSMPNHLSPMGLMGLVYYADLAPYVYGGVGGYGSVVGTQGGLFVLGLGGGFHAPLVANLMGDIGFFAGGGGGRSSLVGGGLMIKPYVGLMYNFKWVRFGLHYSYIDFPDGLIRSQQIGLDLDVPLEFPYVNYHDAVNYQWKFADIFLCNQGNIGFQRNDFAIILQAYKQRAGTKNVLGEIQDGTISLIGAELDHYFTKEWFWWVKSSGAYSGIPNGYMDVLGGLGYHYPLGSTSFALVPQLGLGAGGGGNVDSGGGVLITGQLGLELALGRHFATRLSGGYLVAPKGEIKAATGTVALIYHLDIAEEGSTALPLTTNIFTQAFRIHLFNQTYLHPQRTFMSGTPPINMVALQIDQLLSRYFFMAYQASFAYAGNHAGGYATGMIGPGIQTAPFFNCRAEAYAEVLVGAGGGGSLALGGGSLIEPVVGLHYALTDSIGLTGSVGQLKAIKHDLNTTVINAGITIRFGTVNQI
ncbi:MAG: hypothetical protein H0W64_10695 [Gammaproteobacteria bacterium]|nr:hypothetical protein [Gammaproteobacteria bacterium]